MTTPAGKICVVGVDTFDGTDWIEGYFDTVDAAVEHARRRTDNECMLKMHVYDEHGRRICQSGSF